MVGTTVDTSPKPVQTTRVARRRPGTQRVIAAGVVLLALSIIRPWGSDPAPVLPADRSTTTVGPVVQDTPPPGGGSGVTIADTARAEPSVGPGQIACPPTGWHVVSFDQLAADWTVRTSTPAIPVLAHGPADPAIGELALESPAVVALGLCGPVARTAATPAPAWATATRIVAAWRRTGTGADAVRLEATDGPPEAGLARLYRLPGSPSASSAWPPGHFILQLAATDDTTPAGPDRGGPELSGEAWFVGLLVPPPR